MDDWGYYSDFIDPWSEGIDYGNLLNFSLPSNQSYSSGTSWLAPFGSSLTGQDALANRGTFTDLYTSPYNSQTFNTSSSGGTSGIGGLLSSLSSLLGGTSSKGGQGGLGNILSGLIPAAAGVASALNKPQSYSVQPYTPPMTAIDQSVLNQLQGMVGQGLNLPDNWIKGFQESNAARGLSPSMSGILSKSIASEAMNRQAQNQTFQANLLGQISNINRGYLSQPMVIPPTTSSWERFLGAYTPLISSMNMANAFSNPGGSTWSWI